MKLTSRPAMRGFSLVELMIALVLGLVVIGAASGVFLSNKDNYRTNMALAQVQENSRIAFELLARDLRQTGVTGCGPTDRVVNVVANNTANWWSDFANAITGTDTSITLLGAGSTPVAISAAYTQAAGTLTINANEPNPGIRAGDIVIVCDSNHSAIAQISAVSASTPLVLTVASNAATPGNSTLSLSFDGPQPVANAQVVQLNAVQWAVANNPVGGTSLYRTVPVVSGGNITGTTSQEVVRGVTALQLSYHLVGGASFVDAASVGTAWAQVDAVRVTISLVSTTPAGVDGQPITRQMAATVNLRRF